jgi:hypothetical protein
MVSRLGMRGSLIVGSARFIVVDLVAKALGESKLVSCDLQRPTKSSKGQGEALSLAFVVSVAKIRLDVSDLSRIPC